MLPQYAALEFGLDDRVVHDAVLGEFDADQAGQASPHAQPADYHIEFVCDAVGGTEF
jgi:hypothetical protein